MKAGDRVLMAYYFHNGLDFVTSIHACLYLGIIPVVINPPQMDRLEADAQMLFQVLTENPVKAILVNTPAEDLLKARAFTQELKKYREKQTGSEFALPDIINTTKFAKTVRVMEESVHDVAIARLTNGDARPIAVVQILPTPDGMAFDSVRLTHDTLIAQCTVLKELMDLSSDKPILCCAKPYTGLGFLQAAILGVYVGAPTIMLGQVDYVTNPATFFDILSKYSSKLLVFT